MGHHRRRGGCLPLRLARLGLGRNELRRATDRVEAAVLAGASVRIWLDQAGAPESPPRDIFSTALAFGLLITVAAAGLLGGCYQLVRAGLDRRRLKRWSTAWAVTGPRWTSRR